MSAPSPVSIIVVCRNPGMRLRGALESVWAQRPALPELVVVDGGSTDGTREWLEFHKDRIDRFVSEPDAGVYDAMNKGLALARSEWILFLGADDRLAGAGVLAAAAKTLAETEADVVAGEIWYDNGRVYRFGPRVNPLARNFVHHQAAFYRRSLFSRHGNFDTNLTIMADYDLNLRLWQKDVRFKPVALNVATCGSGGLSDSGRWSGYAEEIQVRHRHFPAWHCWFWDSLSVVRCARKKIVGRKSGVPRSA